MLETTESRANTWIGSAFALSPEMVNKKPYNFKHDIWSMGILLYEMCTFKTPFMADTIN
jgi:NIMA (never in mitosis gene a)-related kinase 1/4/5